MTWYRVGLLSVALLASGCRDRFLSQDEPGCKATKATTGLHLVTHRLAGLTGRVSVFRFHDDSDRVDVAVDERSQGSVVLPAGRLKKLDADLAATGVFSVAPGCWERRDRVPDGGAYSFEIRHDRKWLLYGTSTAAPAAVERAGAVVGALEEEVKALGAIAD